MKYFSILIIFFLICSSGFGQPRIPHFDIPGLIAREIEKSQARILQRQTLRTATAYTVSTPTTAIEKLSRTRLNFNPFTSATINYLEYRNICDSYINPLKKRTCTNKFNYLKDAHTQILSLMQVYTINKINQGVKEQIGEKYTSITNTILKELEQMKRDNEKNKFYRRLLLPKK